ncbi:MAG: PHP domain-containing protein [Spirochaetaceae bacterium]|nr:PHP domain-containing protein [Spirochaetaceae bacterium]
MDTINDVAASPAQRIAALRELVAERPIAAPRSPESNNHIHTCYSFSPYTPAAAALGARKAGLAVAGSVDHDSLVAAAEMREACAVLGMGAVTGFEIRVSLFPENDPFFTERKINNPDSAGIIYMTVQGVPAGVRENVAKFLEQVRVNRRARTQRMVERLNPLLAVAGAEPLDFERDVVARSMYSNGGTITERHMLAAMASSVIAAFGRGESLVSGIESRFGVALSPKMRSLLGDTANPYLEYDLLGLLKSEFLPTIFIQPEAECVSARAAIEFAVSIGAIPAYAYLGDIGESPTGDKKAEKFEDDFLPELFAKLKDLGFLAVTYMPPRNTAQQLVRIRKLCREFGFMEISGVDINQPRQSFNCPELRQPEFAHLNDATWAMVAHEALSSVDSALGLFSPSNPYASASLEKRVLIYAKAGVATVAFADIDEIADSLQKGRYE